MFRSAATKGIRHLAFVSLLLGGHAAVAATIVDTGPGPVGIGIFPPTVNLENGVAAEFSIAQAYTITDVEGWLNASSGSIGTLTAIIYTDGGEVPGSQLFSQAFSVTSVASDFYGAHGLAWLLQPGTYWVAFEVLTGQTFSGVMPGPSTSPLGNEAVKTVLTPTYGQFDSANIGVRLQGSPVPVPAAAWLLGSALIGMTRISRRRRPG
jgi:hypothetical protein